MEYSLKQRLVGAVVLVLLGALLIPLLMNDESTQDSVVLAPAVPPSPTINARRDIVDIDGIPLPTRGPSVSPPTRVPEITAVPTMIKGSAAKSGSLVPTAPLLTLKERSHGESTNKVIKQLAPVSSSPKVKESEGRPQASPSKVPAVAPPVAAGTWFVQVGVFRAAANARALALRLNRDQFESSTESIRSSGHRAYRIRVGPLASAEEADAVKNKLERIGIQGRVVNAP